MADHFDDPRFWSERPTRRNLRPDLNNWCCYGVFALYFTYVPADLKAQYGVDDPTDLWNARTNIEIAYQIYVRAGWDPWSQTDPGSG